MGTNFYLIANNKARHIGKSSAGWCFALHVYPEENIHDLNDWIPLLSAPLCYIKNEYGNVVSFQDMMINIIKRYHPNGLKRSQLNKYCIKHGEGTWDCIVGEFSYAYSF